MRNNVLQLSIGIVLLITIAACGANEDDSSASVDSPAPPAQAPASVIEKAPGAGQTSKETGTESPQASGDITKIEVVNQDPAGSGKYQFSPAEMQFQVGETVEFTITAETEFHTFNVDELSIDQSVDGGETIVFTHTFDTAGTFRLYCIPHGENGMEGQIVVQ